MGAFLLGVCLIDLILKDIADPYVRENFFRLRKFIDSQVIFDGDFKLFDISIPKGETKLGILHGLTFIPADIVTLAFEGDGNFYFHYQDFDRDNIYITTQGAVRVRFLAGKLKDPVRAINSSNPYAFVAPGEALFPTGPGFVYSGVNQKEPGFWLTSEGIPSNVVGVPVLFGNAIVVQAAVGVELDTTYTIGLYQHSGNEANLLELGRFDISGAGTKRFDLDFPIIYNSNDIQLGCRLISGNTTNLKVSLMVKGSGI